MASEFKTGFHEVKADAPLGGVVWVIVYFFAPGACCAALYAELVVYAAKLDHICKAFLCGVVLRHIDYFEWRLLTRLQFCI